MFPKKNKVEPIELTKSNDQKQTLIRRKKKLSLLIFLALLLLTLVVLAIVLPIVLTNNNQENYQTTWSSNSYSTTSKDSKLTSSKSFLNLNQTIPQTTEIEYESSHPSTSTFEIELSTNENHLTSPTSRTFSSKEYTMSTSNFTSNTLDLNETSSQTSKTDPTYSLPFDTDISSIASTITNEISLSSSFNLSKTTFISESTQSDFFTSIDYNILSTTNENRTSFTTSNLLESSSVSTFEYDNTKDVSIISESFYATSINSTTFDPIYTMTTNTFLSTTTETSSTTTTSTFTTTKNFEGFF